MSYPRSAPLSGLTDAEWAVPESHLLRPKSTGPAGGRPSTLRPVVNATLHVPRTRCACRQLPAPVPRRQSTLFHRCSQDGTVDPAVCTSCCGGCERQRVGTASRAGIINAQSVRGAAIVGTGTSGYGAGKPVDGRKRHIVADTLRLLLVVMGSYAI